MTSNFRVGQWVRKGLEKCDVKGEESVVEILLLLKFWFSKKVTEIWRNFPVSFDSTVKFIHSEKATEIWKTFPTILNFVSSVKKWFSKNIWTLTPCKRKLGDFGEFCGLLLKQEFKWFFIFYGIWEGYKYVHVLISSQNEIEFGFKKVWCISQLPS